MRRRERGGVGGADPEDSVGRPAGCRMSLTIASRTKKNLVRH
jgi:hypothetical protein